MGDREPIFGLLEAQFALALYNMCPLSLQKRITYKETKLAIIDHPKLLIGRSFAGMMLDHLKHTQVNATFTPYADIHHLQWAGYTPDQMESVLRNWCLLMDQMPEPARNYDQQRALFFKKVWECQRVGRERVSLYKLPHRRA